jgi:predicted amidohydrolase
MRINLAQLAPVPGDLLANLATVRETVSKRPAELHVFPELFLSGYRIGDGFQQLALDPAGEELASLRRLCEAHATSVVVGAPVQHARRGEILNAAILVTGDGSVAVRAKRFLPTYGPFEEGALFSAARSSETAPLGGHPIGLQICYDAFFPEVSRELALQGAELLVVLSAAPVTSRRLFDRVLPARAVENALPLVYVNRVRVEDGVVFGGGSQAFDARGEAAPSEGYPETLERSAQAVWSVEIDLREAARWRPFRPVLRDVATVRASGSHEAGAPSPRAGDGHAPGPTQGL